LQTFTAPMATLDPAELDRLFTFLGRIQHDAELRERLNWMQTASEVSDLAAASGQPFRPDTLIELFRLCDEVPHARVGLMDEKLIRVYLRRGSLADG
jgi:hypothetical protein